jgi:hypothetical protein
MVTVQSMMTMLERLSTRNTQSHKLSIEIYTYADYRLV